jgi:hypothetical protein
LPSALTYSSSLSTLCWSSSRNTYSSPSTNLPSNGSLTLAVTSDLKERSNERRRRGRRRRRPLSTTSVLLHLRMNRRGGGVKSSRGIVPSKGPEVDDNNSSTTATTLRSPQQSYRRYFHACCALCGLQNGVGLTEFQFCGKCRIVVYCSRDHQVAHWKMHKRFCKENAWDVNVEDSSAGDLLASANCGYLSCSCKNWSLSRTCSDPSVLLGTVAGGGGSSCGGGGKFS